MPAKVSHPDLAPVPLRDAFIDLISVIPNKSNNAMPYISLPYRPKVQTKGEWKRSQRLSLPPADLNGRHIDLAPWPESINERGYVTFRDTGRPESDRMKQEEFKPDVVVFATGYTQVFPFLVETYPTPDEADFRRIWKTEQPDVGFIGFVRPNFGRAFFVPSSSSPKHPG